MQLLTLGLTTLLKTTFTNSNSLINKDTQPLRQRNNKISSFLDKNNILLRFKRNAYAITLQEVQQLLKYYIALSLAYLTLPKKQLHRDKVLEPLKGYNTIFKHLYAIEYKQAILKKFTRLIDQGIFEYKE